jgi:hypothetical protein
MVIGFVVGLCTGTLVTCLVLFWICGLRPGVNT